MLPKRICVYVGTRYCISCKIGPVKHVGGGGGGGSGDLRCYIELAEGGVSGRVVGTIKDKVRGTLHGRHDSQGGIR